MLAFLFLIELASTANKSHFNICKRQIIWFVIVVVLDIVYIIDCKLARYTYMFVVRTAALSKLVAQESTTRCVKVRKPLNLSCLLFWRLINWMSPDWACVSFGIRVAYGDPITPDNGHCIWTYINKTIQLKGWSNPIYIAVRYYSILNN